MRYNTISRFIFVIAAAMAAGSASAAPAYPYPITYRQPDGDTLTITLRGDERASWAVSEDGYTLLSGRDGSYQYATVDATGNMRPSGVRARSPRRRSNADRAFLRRRSKGLGYSPAQRDSFARRIPNVHRPLRLNLNSGKPNTPPGMQRAGSTPSNGIVRFPVILINFTNKQLTLGADRVAQYTALLNTPNYTSANGTPGSVRDYFYDQSYGKVEYQADVFGPFTVDNDDTYYNDMYPSKNNPSGDPRLLAKHAVEKADAAINFANYDNDGDGEVDCIHIIYAGFGSEASGATAGDIWAHKWEIDAVWGGHTTPTAPQLDGVTIKTYLVTAEKRGGSAGDPNPANDINYIGLPCHEYGHAFGLPDFYDTNGADTYGYETVTNEFWDIMCYGSWNDNGRTPAGHNPWSKNFLGWSPPPATLTNDTNAYTLPHPDSSQGRAYKMLSMNAPYPYTGNITNKGRYFLIENRQQTSKWDTHLPASGMLIYYVDETTPLNDNMNQEHNSRRFYIKQAGCTQTNGCYQSRCNDLGVCHSVPSTGYSHDKDVFPQTDRDYFDDTGIPNSLVFGGNTMQPITNITQNTGGVITFNYQGITAMLTNLQVSSSAVLPLQPSFNSNTHHYRCTVPHATSSVSVAGESLGGGVASFFNYVSILSGTGNVSLAVGNNTHTVRCTALFGSANYVIDIRRQNNNFNLDSLSMNVGAPIAFNPNTLTYSVSVPSATSSVTVSALPADSNASVTGAGVHAVSRTNNRIDIKVKAEDTTIQRTYTIFLLYSTTGTLIFEGEGVSIPPRSVTVGYTITRPAPDPSRTEYTFDGWYKDPARTEEWNFATDLITSDTTRLYAKWTAYKVILFISEGAVFKRQAKPLNSVVDYPDADPERSGFTFLRWCKNPNLTSAWDFDNDRVNADTIRLYADWTPYRVVRFMSEGAVVEQRGVPMGSKLERPADPVRNGYLLDNWYKTSTYSGIWKFAEETVTADTTYLYARWLAAGVVIFANSSIPPQTIPLGRKVTKPTPDPERTGFIFDAWYRDTTFMSNREWIFTKDTLTADTTRLYPHWFKEHMVIFTSADSIIRTMRLTYGASITKPADPVRAECTFVRWDFVSRSTGNCTAWDFTTMNVTADTTTLRAVWDCGSTGISAQPQPALRLYPTYVSGLLTILDAPQGKAEIYSMDGSLMGAHDIGGAASVIDLAYLPAGTYIVRAGGRTAKIVKMQNSSD